ncbi:hypothetical protein VNI00_016545 [Paramarasmius palmivorus]|uniref:Uncharacterized protein n=1 Tax=Paramarasmius palmivorus TaxID=297713 RepID=A0AAW0BF45_9AGAR
MWNPTSSKSLNVDGQDQDLKDEQEVASLLWPRIEEIYQGIWEDVLKECSENKRYPQEDRPNDGRRKLQGSYGLSNATSSTNTNRVPSSVEVSRRSNASSHTRSGEDRGYLTRVPIFVPQFELPIREGEDGNDRPLEDHERGLLTIAAYGSLCAETNRRCTSWVYELVNDD